MFELGMKDKCFGAGNLRVLKSKYGCEIYEMPTQIPSLKEDERVICGYDQGLGEKLIVCETLEDMQQLYTGYTRGGALRIQWYIGTDVGFINIISGGAETKD